MAWHAAPRLTSSVWVSAYLTRLQQQGIYAHVARRGDGTAGAVAVKVALMDGTASFFTRVFGPEGDRVWEMQLEAAPEAQVDEALARQRRYDPDLWIIEVEDPRGRHLLDAPGLAE